MKCLVFLSVILHSLTLTAQTSPDYQKLSKACEVWGLIKYFHPGKPGPQFDSAFAAQVPRMLSARIDNDWATVFNELLSVLHDPSTRVVNSGKQSGGEFTAEFTKDSVLYVRLFGFEMFDDFGRAQSFMRDVIAKAGLSKGIIFDLRNKTDISKEYEGYLNSYFNYKNALKRRPLKELLRRCGPNLQVLDLSKIHVLFELENIIDDIVNYSPNLIEVCFLGNDYRFYN